MKTHYPLARTKELVVQHLPDETLVYDLRTDAAHCLNSTAALIWSLCSGKNSIEEIGRLVKNKFAQHANEEFVWLALDSLKKADLLDDFAEMNNKFAGLSRREVIRKVGLTTLVALPVVASLVAPTAAEGATGNCGEPCTAFSPCSGVCTNCTSDGAGRCGNSAVTCTNIGGSCSVTGVCQDTGFFSICNVDFAPCNNPGGPCFGTSTCRQSSNGTCSR